LPEKITIPACSRVTLPLYLIPPDQQDSKISFSGSFNGKPISNLVMHCKRTKYWRHVPLRGTRSAKNWTASCGGTMTIADDHAENAIRFNARIPNPKNRWIYPIYQLKLPNESLKGAYAIEFEIKLAADTPPPSFTIVQLSSHGYRHHLKYTPEIGKWQKCLIRINGVRSIEAAKKIIQPESIDKFMIGLSPKAEKTTYWIRNIRLVYAPAEGKKIVGD